MTNNRIGFLVAVAAALSIAQFSFSQQTQNNDSGGRMNGTSAMTNDRPMPSDGREHDLTLKEKMTKIMLTDNSFVKKAAIANRAEIELSKLALNKTQNAQVEKFAQQMVTDHSAAARELEQIAGSKNIGVPDELDHSHSSALENLGKLSGSEFDAEFNKQMREDHDDVVSLFTAAADDNSLAPELRGFATKMLPTLRNHQHDTHALKTGSSNAAL